MLSTALFGFSIPKQILSVITYVKKVNIYSDDKNSSYLCFDKKIVLPYLFLLLSLIRAVYVNIIWPLTILTMIQYKNLLTNTVIAFLKKN